MRLSFELLGQSRSCLCFVV